MNQDYQPQVLVETGNLSREEWLAYRRKGIGGSDVAAVLGVSPFRTARDLYYDKLGIAAPVVSDDNWVQLEVGNLLEPLVARIFEKKTGLKVYQRKAMFYHPKYPWMQADLDYLVDLPDGATAILEIKTTNYNARDNWWYNGQEIVPLYYDTQGVMMPSPLWSCPSNKSSSASAHCFVYGSVWLRRNRARSARCSSSMAGRYSADIMSTGSPDFSLSKISICVSSESRIW